MNDFAITNCRVSSAEQLENNSLNRQQEAVLKAAKELGVIIPSDGQWSGHVSSKAGTNVHRKDIKEMLEYCRKNKRVKYLIVDEPDRFMRSIKEANYFEVLFDQLGVRIWYASDPDLNTNDMSAKMMQFVKYFAAEGSNEERQKKSITGGQKAIREGRYPSSPKPGYQKGVQSGIHDIAPVTALPLKSILLKLSERTITPTDALKELNGTAFGKKYAKLKMDRFRLIACDPYYAGVVELKGKFNLRNENGLHTPLITMSQHEQILRVFSRNPKSQFGHRKNKNEVYPLSNKLTCSDCEGIKKYPRFTSCPISNGRKRKTTKFYEKYRCRGCNKYLDKDDTHDQFSDLLNETVFPDDQLTKLREKLVKIFNAKHSETQGEILRLNAVNNKLREDIANKVDAATDPAHAFIKEEIFQSIQKLKIQLADNEDRIRGFSEQRDNDLNEFLTFAFSFLDDKGKHFFDLTDEDMKRCKQLVFPAEIYVDKNKNVYTNEITSIFRGRTNKKDTVVSSKSSVVRVQGL